MTILLANADAKRIPLADKSVNCVVTSPPYFGQRDYGTAEWVGGDARCDHLPHNQPGPNATAGNTLALLGRTPYKKMCKKCGAVHVDNQIGLEGSPDEYVEAICRVFDEVWRVLRDDGTVWLVIWDSYAGSGKGLYADGTSHGTDGDKQKTNAGSIGVSFQGKSNLKPKDLIGIPWRVAFALQERGWWLRQDIIWSKLNPMPESVTDRCTRSHEYIFLLTKSARYWYDNEAIKEDSVTDENSKASMMFGPVNGKNNTSEKAHAVEVGHKWHYEPKRNKRSVWTVATRPYPGNHYATYPADLIEPCILAGCPETVCAECGAPYERVVEVDRTQKNRRYRDWRDIGWEKDENNRAKNTGNPVQCINPRAPTVVTLGFQPTCSCNADTRPGIVLDPFVGSGTTCLVARKHRRHAIGLDLNFDYLNTNARERLAYGGYVPVADGINQLTIGV